MSIVSSSYVLDGPAQADGSQWIRETHTDHLGGLHRWPYKALPSINRETVLAVHALRVAEMLADDEYDRLILVPGLITIEMQTNPQFAGRFRQDYQSSDRERCAYLATWALNHIDNGNFTDAGVRNVFGLTVNQYNTLKAKWTALRTNWNAVQAAAGE